MKCPVCANTTSFTSLRPAFCDAGNYLCLKCGLVSIPREQAPVQQYYKDDGYFKKSPNFAYRKQLISKSFIVKEARNRIKGALSILPVELKSKSVLDIGCGYGEILYCLKNKYGCQVMGIEASGQASEYGRKLFSIPIYKFALEEFESKEKFDIIWCSHVLEHTANPSAFLKKIKSLLKSDGCLYLEAPNIFKPTGGFSLNKFLYNEHLQTFSAYNLYLLLKKNGFAVVGYSDSDFLKFWCRKSYKSIVVPQLISSDSVMSFLEGYNSEYNVLCSARVYMQKILYGARLAIYKARDIF